MNEPSVCVVVPTRERADTLEHSLRTLVSQSYEKLEILVCDNASQDRTRDVVASFDDPRIRYINPGRRLSMSDNWEFALSHVKADYVTIIGDDDGLIPDAISDLVTVLGMHPSLAIAWQYAEYFWPTHADTTRSNSLLIPIRNKLVQVDSKLALKHMFEFVLGYTRGPCIYYSLVSMNAVRRVIERDGRMFHSVSPDVYSSLVLSSVTDSYLFSTRPFSIAGASRHSTGHSHISSKAGEAKTASTSWVSENALQEVEFSQVGGSITAIALDTMIRFKSHAKCPGPALQHRRALRMVVRELNAIPGAVESNVAILVALAERMGLGNYLQRLLEDKHSGDAFTTARKMLSRPPFTGAALAGNHLRVHADRYRISDIFGASEFVGNLLCPYVPPENLVRYSLLRAGVSRFASRLSGADFFLAM